MAGSNAPPFAAELNYSQEIAKQEGAHLIRENLKISAHEGVADLKSNEGLQAKNVHLLRSEIRQQVSAPNPLKLLVAEELHFSTALVELLEKTLRTPSTSGPITASKNRT